MKLLAAAKYFDRDSVYDAYTGLLLFKGQFASYDGSQPDGSFSRRRTVSVAPNVVHPARSVVQVHGEKWIVGEFITDGFFDAPIRKTASAKQVTDLFTFLTPGQAALGVTTATPALVSAYGQERYLKDTVNTPTTSDYSPQYEITFGPNEVVPDEYFLRSPNDLYHIRTTYRALEGFTVATADLIGATDYGENKYVTAVFGGGIDPITELPAAGTTTTGILLYAYKLYFHATEADPKNNQGDKTLIVAKSAVTPVNGAPVTIDSEAYRIFGITSYHDSWNLRVRRA